MKTKLFLALTTLTVLSCNQKEQHSDTQHEEHTTELPANDPVGEVLAIHDSIMPQMEKIMALKMQIKTEVKTVDSLIAIKGSSVLNTRKNQATELLTQLDAADKGMMNWMHQYKGDTLKKLDEQAASQYIADQKQKIMNVRDNMVKSIGDAELFIQKAQQP